MPITAFLRYQAFEPEMTETMSSAFTRACADLGLKDRSDKITEMVAQCIIEAAQRGVHTETALYLIAMQEFRSKR